MSEISFLCVIVNRSEEKKLTSFLIENNIPVIMSSLGRGTASDEIMELLGLGEPEKSMLLCTASSASAEKAMRKLVTKLRFDAPGNGIAFTVPINSVGGALTFKYLSGGENPEGLKGEEKMDKALNEYDVIVAIANRGYVDTVMDAARGAGATGGTVIHAKGTGKDQTEKFFGVSIASEKEMVFIVTRTTLKSDIIKAIITQAGTKTKAGAIVFSMPVGKVEGINNFEDNEETE